MNMLKLTVKIPELQPIKLFVSDVFRERCISASLKGFRFIEVWDSERGGSTEKLSPVVQGIADNSAFSMSYADAAQHLLSGKAIASGKPIFHELKWQKVEHSDDI